MPYKVAPKYEPYQYRPFGNAKDLTGMKFGDWTVLEYDPYPKSTARGPHWKCRCELCGRVSTVHAYRLTGGETTNCGCARNTNNGKRRFKDLTGQVFGRLTVIGFDHMEQDSSKDGIKRSHSCWKCRCECGNDCVVSSPNLVKGYTKSCGCLHTEASIALMKSLGTHGDSSSKLYRIYVGMVDRCHKPNNSGYYKYGAKGIKVCQEWHNPDSSGSGWDKRRLGNPGWEAFKKWAMTPIEAGGGGYYEQPKDTPYMDTLSIDRINSKGDYEPSNCRFITMREQAANRSNNRLFYDGESIGTYAAIGKKYGMKFDNHISTHLHDGWTPNALVHGMKNKDLGMRKVGDRFIDKNGNTIRVPDYGACLVRKTDMGYVNESGHIVIGRKLAV